MVREYKPYPKRIKQINDAKLVIGSVLELEISIEMKKKIIREMIWNITGADYKYKIRYQSLKCIENSNVNVRHEHIFRLKNLIQEVISNKENYSEILDKKAIACVVTKEEHDILNKNDKKYKNIDGWCRYKIAGIEIYDFVNEVKINIHDLCNSI